jgi:tetratricopeptide (TPR) repeat protein
MLPNFDTRLQFIAIAILGLALTSISILGIDPLAPLRSHDAAYFRRQAEYFERRGMPARAIAAYVRARGLAPFDREIVKAHENLQAAMRESDPVLLQARADLKRSQGDLAGALADYDRAIAVTAHNAALYFLRGTARLQAGDRPGAAADFEAGLKLDPTNKTLQVLLSTARADPPDGQNLPSNDPVAAKNLQTQADIKRKEGDLAGAVEDYSEAIRVGPPNTALFYLRGTARLELGDGPGAAEDFRAGLKLDPNNPTLRQLLEQARLKGGPAIPSDAPGR